MANGYKVVINSITSDGTNYYVEIGINDGVHQLPVIVPVFPVGTLASVITAYIQQVATNGPALTSDISALVGTSVTA